MQGKGKLDTSIAVTGSYSPLGASPIYSEEKWSIEVSQPEFKVPDDYYGPLVYQDDVVGKIVVWANPEARQEDIDKLSFAVDHFERYIEFKEQYREAIQSSPFVQWTLIPFLLGAQISGLRPLALGKRPDAKSRKEFFHFLVQQGAAYKHYLAGGAYSIPTLEIFKLILEIYGVEATIPNGNTLDLITLILTSHYDHTSLDKVKALLLAGVNINARIDTEYQNTILHYLIALEHGVGIVIKLIDFVEKNASNLDYTLQDRFGKTPLLLAVGLNVSEVVNKLLKDVLGENKKNIGLDLPDNEGRTPCMIAAALGHLDILQRLIEAGANCYLRDNQGRDLTWYTHASPDEIKSILSGLSIQPDRDVSQNHSYLYSLTREAYPLLLVEQQSGHKQLLLLSQKEPYCKQLEIALEASKSKKDPKINYDYLKQQIDSMLVNKSKMSVLDQKITNQLETRRYVQEVLFRFACAFGDLETVERIGAEKSFNFISCDHLSRTAMHYAVMTKKLLGNLIKSIGYPGSVEDCIRRHSKVLEYLIHKNNGLLYSENKNRNTPLSLLQRDVNSDDADTRQQAQIMLDLLIKMKANGLDVSPRFRGDPAIDTMDEASPAQSTLSPGQIQFFCVARTTKELLELITESTATFEI